MKKLGTILAALVIVGFVAPGAAQAAEKKKNVQVQWEKKTVLDFEDDTIQGDLTRPDGEYVDARKKVKHSNLIKIREEFRDEVLESVGEL